MATVARVTPDELARMPDGKDFELVSGELLERPMSTLSSFVNGQLVRRLGNFAEETGAGWVFDAENGYQCFPHDPMQVRKPDVSFVAADRLSATDIGDGWLRLIPDLAVEVISPRDTFGRFEEKLDDYREAGFPVVWVIFPEVRSVYVHRPSGIEQFSGDVELVGEGPLDGFRCRLSELLPTMVD